MSQYEADIRALRRKRERPVRRYELEVSDGGSSVGSVGWADVTGKPLFSAVGLSGDYSDLLGLPSTFAPSGHGHAMADVVGLSSALAGKQAAGSYAAAVHGHVAGDVAGLGSAALSAAGDFAAAAHSHGAFTSGAAGFVPASGGGTTNFLRADGTFAAPAGGGGGSSPILSWVI